MQEAFRENGFVSRLNVARDGEQAIAMLRKQDPYSDMALPALVLLDLNLPRKKGRDVLAEIKGSDALRHVPVFIISTSTREEDVLSAYDLQANCYIPKPIDLKGLLDMGKLIEAFWIRLVVLPDEVRSWPRPPVSQRIS